MHFTLKDLQVNRNLRLQFDDLVANRKMFNVREAIMANEYSLSTNASIPGDFWAEMDRSVVAQRESAVGMEILTDLSAVQTVLPVGKTAKLYAKVGDIASDVAVSIDGQAPFSYDHTEYDTDGDPIPVFTAGYGVNWRHAEGLRTIGWDLVQDSQEAKMQVFNEKLVDYMLNGSDRILVDGKAGQGLKNHRNTKKIDLGLTGANINLTTATAAQVAAFLTTGAFGLTARENRVTAYDVLWVSPEIYANLALPFAAGGVNYGSGLDYVNRFATNVREIRPTFALSGNEFLGYVRDRQFVTPLVGAAVGVTALPRFLPQSNFNFQILSAMGLQVKTNGAGRGGVVYGAAA